jgi:threonine aldolase
MMIGEAVIFFNKTSKNKFKFIRKQGMQLASKMRFISVQFEAFLTNDLWLRNALHANRMAKLLAAELEKIPGCTITQKVEANAVFIAIAHKYIDEIQKKFFFNIWEKQQPVIRLMTSFNTEEEDIQELIQVIKKIVES